jgi:DNA polymerase III epsilon subunit-like protein
MSFVVVDLETSSLKPSSAEILTADFIVMNDDLEIVDKAGFKFRPRIWGKEADGAAEIHGITREEAYTFHPYRDEILKMFEWLLVGKRNHLIFHANRQFNTSYDAAILRFHALDNGYYFDFGQCFPESKYLSTHSMAKYLKIGSKLNLKALCNYFNLGDFSHHNSEEDCRMTQLLFMKMINDINIPDFLEWESWAKKGIQNEGHERTTGEPKKIQPSVWH